MNKRPGRFNLYLAVAALSLGLGGCQTGDSGKKKEISTLRLHLEVNPDGTGYSHAVPVFRENPVMVNVEKSPFLTEANVAEATVLHVMGGYVIQLQFDRRGQWLLDQYSTANKGRRVAIFSQFGQPARERWLAAPVMAQRITNGTLVFTPDATREEAESLVRGLNNVAAQAQKHNP